MTNYRRIFTALTVLAMLPSPASAWTLVFKDSGISSTQLTFSTEEFCMAAGRYTGERGYAYGNDWIAHATFMCVPNEDEINQLIITEKVSPEGVPK